MTPDDVKAIYNAQLERLKLAEPEAEDGYLKKHAWMGTRTLVQEALQNAHALPERGDEHKEFVKQKTEAMEKNDLANRFDHLVRMRMRSDEIHAERQKVHFISLWEKADALLKDAGVTPEGSV